MKKVYLIIICLIISEWCMSQNAGGMISRPNSAKGIHKPVSSNNQKIRNQEKKADSRFFKYDSADDFEEGMSLVTLNGKVGYIDNTGREIIPCKYEFGSGIFREGLAKVRLNKKYGYIDKTGHVVIPLKYDNADFFHDGLGCVKRNDLWGFVDRKGNEVISCKYNSFLPPRFSDGLALVYSSYIDKKERVVIPYKFEGIGNFREGLACVRQNGKYGFVDKKGNEVVPCKYDWANDYSEGLASVKLNGKYGYIDKTGQLIISCKYDSVGYSHHGGVTHDYSLFSEGYACMKLKGKYGIIDKVGNEVIPFKYDEAFSFKEGLALVVSKGKYIY